MKPSKPPKKLTWNEKQEVRYAIPQWLKDQQIQSAIARPIPRIQGSEEKRPEPCAIVCFGPSLNQTWEKLREFKYIMTCSGSHKFLLERGIVPTWHAEVDPRAHKIKLLGPPHPDVTYLPASTCHPAYFDHIAGHKTQLWHVFDSRADEIRLLPAGEWAITGGSSIGLRCMTLARFFGFTDLHVFGMDGSFGTEAEGAKEGTHASPHPNGPPFHNLCEYDGVFYRTTASMLECARQTPHELNQMPDVTATFYGEGLVQAMMKKYVREPPKLAAIGFSKPELISEEYRKLNAELHRTNVAYGVGGERHAGTVMKLAESMKTKNVLDYGSGKGRLGRAIPYAIAEYDPAIPGKDESPKPADLVCALDMLEHVEPECIDYVCADLQRVTLQMLFAVIHTGPSSKKLADGRNAHVLIRSHEWWKDQLSRFFRVAKTWEVGPLVYALLVPLKRPPIIQQIQPVILPPNPEQQATA